MLFVRQEAIQTLLDFHHPSPISLAEADLYILLHKATESGQCGQKSVAFLSILVIAPILKRPSPCN